MVVEEFQTIAARARPAPVESIEATQIHALRAARAFQALQEARVRDGQHAERQPRKYRPERRNAPAHERHPQQNGTHAREDQPGVGEEEVTAIEVDNPPAPPGQTAIVFSARVSHWLNVA
jgi:hypothetical protein